MRTLLELVNHYVAQKPEYYLPIYEELLASFRDQEISLLEIGVQSGASLLVWHDWFPHARICGIDILPQPRQFPERVSFCQGDQSDAAFLQDVADSHGPFDIIIDDGSHKPDHWMASYRALIPHLRPGGLYAIEDLQAPRHAWLGWPPEEITSMRTRLAELINPMIRQEPADDIDRMILHQHIVILQKAKS